MEAVFSVRAEVCESLGDIDQAEQLLRRLVASRRTRLGEEHPALAWNLHCLARLIFEQRGDVTESETLTRQALRIQSSRKGPDHLDTADCAVLLGRILMARSSYHEAEEHLQENLRIREMHPDMIVELKKARELLDRCLDAEAVPVNRR
jgi:tetratricopeptide (TPR) repeat protein